MKITQLFILIALTQSVVSFCSDTEFKAKRPKLTQEELEGLGCSYCLGREVTQEGWHWHAIGWNRVDRIDWETRGTIAQALRVAFITPEGELCWRTPILEKTRFARFFKLGYAVSPHNQSKQPYEYISLNREYKIAAQPEAMITYYRMLNLVPIGGKVLAK